MKEPNPRHPAWGMISLNHQTGNGIRLFRSPTEAHARICLRISQASMTMADDRIGNESRPWCEEQIVEVYLSPVQFAELITQPNRGDGVPCTIGRLGVVAVEPPPKERDALHEAAERAGTRGVAESVRVLDRLITDLNARIEQKKAMSLTDLRDLAKDLGVARMRATTDLEYWRKEMSGRAEAMRAKIATELHATADLIVRNMGLGALAEKARAMLPTFEAERAIEVDREP